MSQMKKLGKQRGIGLLELMLSLSIIAILLVMATRYFMASDEQQKINNAISQINGIIAGEMNYYQSNSPPKYTASIKDLIDGNYIPGGLGGSDLNGKGANPWAGDISVSLPTAGGIAVALNNIPMTPSPSTCAKLQNTINNTMSGATSNKNAICAGGTVTVIFH